MCSHYEAKPTVSRGPLARAGAFLLLSLVLALNGCTAVGPNFETPKVDLQKTWLETDDPRVETQTADVSRWWKVFDDPALNQLIQLAYQQNLPLQIAGLRILQARAQLGIAIGQQYPQQQEAFGSATGVRISENAANSFGANQSFFDYQLGFDAAWELDFWGRFRRGVEAADASLTASVADYDNALVSLTAEVARTYAVIRTVEVLIQLARKNAQLQERGLQIADVRFRNGATTQPAVTQART